MSDSGRSRRPAVRPSVESGFLFSDGMSGGTYALFLPPWDLRPRSLRRIPEASAYPLGDDGTRS